MRYLIKNKDGRLTVSGYHSSNTIATLTYMGHVPTGDKYMINYISFNAPRFPIKEIDVRFAKYNEGTDRYVGRANIIAYVRGHNVKDKIEFSNTSIMSIHINPNMDLDTYLGLYFDFIYSFDTIDDLKILSSVVDPSYYTAPETLQNAIHKISSILNKKDKSSPHCYELIKWLEVAFLRFDLDLRYLKQSEKKGEVTQFAELDPILAKHGYALFKK